MRILAGIAARVSQGGGEFSIIIKCERFFYLLNYKNAGISGMSDLPFLPIPPGFDSWHRLTLYIAPFHPIADDTGPL